MVNDDSEFDDEARAIERHAPTPEFRLRGLQTFADHGVRTYVSMSPTYPTLGKADIRALMERLADLNPAVIFHEPINPRGANFQMTIDAAWAAGEDDLAAELARIRESEQRWASYAMQHLQWVQELGAEMGLPVHLWPDKSLLGLVGNDQRRWLLEWLGRQSPEEFAGRETPDDPMPELPSEGQQSLDEWEVSG